MKTIQAVLIWATKELLTASESARLDAEVLLANVLTKQRTYLIAFSDELLSEQHYVQFKDLVRARQGGRPIAYLLGHKEFWSLQLKVTADTLIPRPDTEIVIETALSFGLNKAARVLDLGTGSGAIALALAVENSHWEICAVDQSLAALAVAKENAQAHKLFNVQFSPSNWFESVSTEPYDLIVSNPPYIAEGDPHLSEGDVQHEPRSALVSCKNGYADYERIIEHAGSYLKPQGWLLFEHGFEQAKKLRKMLTQAQFKCVETRTDYSGNDRVSFGRWG